MNSLSTSAKRKMRTLLNKAPSPLEAIWMYSSGPSQLSSQLMIELSKPLGLGFAREQTRMVELGGLLLLVHSPHETIPNIIIRNETE